jgi:hypothetical protein
MDLHESHLSSGGDLVHTYPGYTNGDVQRDGDWGAKKNGAKNAKRNPGCEVIRFTNVTSRWYAVSLYRQSAADPTNPWEYRIFVYSNSYPTNPVYTRSTRSNEKRWTVLCINGSMFATPVRQPVDTDFSNLTQCWSVE